VQEFGQPGAENYRAGVISKIVEIAVSDLFGEIGCVQMKRGIDSKEIDRGVFEPGARAQRSYYRNIERLIDGLHLPLPIDYNRIEELRIVRSQLAVSFEDIVLDIEAEIRGPADVNWRRDFAARAWPNVIRDVVYLQNSLRQSRSNLAVVVDDVVAHIKCRVGRTAVIVAQTRIARGVVRPKIVMPGYRTVRARERTVAVVDVEAPRAIPTGVTRITVEEASVVVGDLAEVAPLEEIPAGIPVEVESEVPESE